VAIKLANITTNNQTKEKNKMKIIGKTYDKLICEIDENEIARVFDAYSPGYFSEKSINISLKIGSCVDLSAGYQFRNDISNICKGMIETNKLFARTQESLLKFAELAIKPEEAK
jgi:hypothetical protein